MKAANILRWNSGVGLGYGYLYNFYASRNTLFPPTDWILPDSSDTLILLLHLRGLVGLNNEGGPLKEAGLIHWNSPNTDATNSSGFNGLGSSYRYSDGFGVLKDRFLAAITDDSYPNDPITMNLHYDKSTFGHAVIESGENNSMGVSVRLLYTGAGTPTTVTDYDGNIYDVVLIGTQYWTVQNWKCTHLNNGTLIPNVTDNATWQGLTTLARCAYDND